MTSALFHLSFSFNNIKSLIVRFKEMAMIIKINKIAFMINNVRIKFYCFPVYSGNKPF